MDRLDSIYLEVRRVSRLIAVSGLGLLLACAFLWLLQPPRSAAAFVSGTARTWPGAAPCNTTLQACINSSAPGDIIHIAAGFHLTSFSLNQAVSLIGAGAGSTFLQALPNQRVITVTAVMTGSTLISDLTIQGGNPGLANGGGIYLASGARPTIQNVTLDSNSAASGGGIYASSPITLINVILNNNSAINGSGGGLYAAGSAYASNSTIQNNTVISNGYGGGMLINGNFVGTNLDFTGNAVHNGYDGGGLYVSGALTLTGGHFTNNRTTKIKSYGGGGGVMAFGKAIITGTLFEGNQVLRLGRRGLSRLLCQYQPQQPDQCAVHQQHSPNGRRRRSFYVVPIDAQQRRFFYEYILISGRRRICGLCR